MTITQAFNAITGVSTLTLAICLTVMHWRSRRARLATAALLPADRRGDLLIFHAAFWCIPVMLFLGSLKVFSYAFGTYESVWSTILTGLTAGVAVVSAGIFLVNLVRVLARGE